MAEAAAAMMLGAGLISAVGQWRAGNEAKAAADAEAAQMRAQAGQARAASQYQAADIRRQERLAQSRLQTVAGASGGGASDVTVMNLAGDIAEEGNYRALTALYNGEEQARNLEYGADVTRWQGRNAQKSSRVAAFGSILGGAAQGASMYAKYGGGGPTNSVGAIDRAGGWRSTPYRGTDIKWTSGGYG